jgi:hypothetical protein
MKKTIVATFVFLITIFLFSSMVNKPLLNSVKFVNIHWKLSDISQSNDATEKATVCFKSDNTFWHYRTRDSRVDSLMFSRWGIEDDKIFFIAEDLEKPKFGYIKIISCDNKYMVLDDLIQKRQVKLQKVISVK